MSIHDLKQRADRLAAAAEAERLKRNRHTAHCVSDARRKIGSPVGLAVAFAVGVVAGGRPSAGTPDVNGSGRGFAHQLFQGPLGTTAGKIASALIAGTLARTKYSTNHPTNQPDGRDAADAAIAEPPEST